MRDANDPRDAAQRDGAKEERSGDSHDLRSANLYATYRSDERIPVCEPRPNLAHPSELAIVVRADKQRAEYVGASAFAGRPPENHAVLGYDTVVEVRAETPRSTD